MITRVRLPIYNRWLNRGGTSKFVNWYYLTWHILRSSTLPLCSIYRSSICNHSGVYSVISPIHRTNIKPQVTQSTIHSNICRSKYNLLSPTLLRASRNTPTILRLPWWLHHMKHCFIHRINDFASKSYNINLHHLRKNKNKPTNPFLFEVK
jgi:hypothetical protein